MTVNNDHLQIKVLTDNWKYDAFAENQKITVFSSMDINTWDLFPSAFQSLRQTSPFKEKTGTFRV
jgi:hypothetical protein